MKEILENLAECVDINSAFRFTADFFTHRGMTLGQFFETEPRLIRSVIGLFGASPVLARALINSSEALETMATGEEISIVMLSTRLTEWL